MTMRRVSRTLSRTLRRLRRPAHRRAGANAAASTLLGRSGDNPLAEYDALPAPLRRWLAEAAMPWSPRSALRIWRRVLRRSGGDVAKAQAEMSRIEAERLAEDVARVWGPRHPYLADRPARDRPRVRAPSAPEVRRGPRR
jgi:hypothetical protein